MPVLTSTCSFMRMRQIPHMGLKKGEKANPTLLISRSDIMMKFFSLNNLKFCDYDDCIYPIVLEITDTTDKARSTSYLDNLEIDRRAE